MNFFSRQALPQAEYVSIVMAVCRSVCCDLFQLIFFFPSGNYHYLAYSIINLTIIKYLTIPGDENHILKIRDHVGNFGSEAM